MQRSQQNQNNTSPDQNKTPSDIRESNFSFL